MTKRGVILFNLGGPARLSDVRPFLFRLFSDPDILVGIPAPIRILLAAFIALVKGTGSKKIYAEAFPENGGGSPIFKWTGAQARGLEERLARRFPNDRVKVVIGMRAAPPFIGDALDELRAFGADEITLLPLFPQFSTTTTGSCFKEFYRALKRARDWKPSVREIRSWPDHPGYVKLTARTIQEGVQAAAKNPALKTHILFSAHSLPMKIIERGDPYPDEIRKTVELAAQGLPYPWSLAFQSKNGPVPWLKPYTEDAIEHLAESGIEQIVLVPVSFVSDHIETTYELDILYSDLARSRGVRSLIRTRMFNDDPEFQDVLADVYFRGQA